MLILILTLTTTLTLTLTLSLKMKFNSSLSMSTFAHPQIRSPLFTIYLRPHARAQTCKINSQLELLEIKAGSQYVKHATINSERNMSPLTRNTIRDNGHTYHEIIGHAARLAGQLTYVRSHMHLNTAEIRRISLYSLQETGLLIST